MKTKSHGVLSKNRTCIFVFEEELQLLAIKYLTDIISRELEQWKVQIKLFS